MTGDDRVAIIAVDYAHQRRLKLFGHARIVTADEDAELLNSLADNAYEAVVERAVFVGVEAYDWNCQQHSPLGSLSRNFNQCLGRCDQIGALQAENARLRNQLHGAARG